MTDRRHFLKSIAAAASTAAVASVLPTACGSTDDRAIDGGLASGSGLIVPKGQGLRITGTFLDEISHDIPHQNWGEKEWDRDFRYMKSIGIDMVICIRSGYRNSLLIRLRTF